MPRKSSSTRALASAGVALSALFLQLHAPVLHAASQEPPDPAAGWGHLWFEVLVDITVLGVVFAAIAGYFVFKYRRRSPGEEGRQPLLSAQMAVGWTLIPVFLFLADDLFIAANGWGLWNDYRRVPADRLEVQLESGMYSWTYTYPNGVQSYNELRVPAGKPVMLRMTSRDTIHSLFIPDFRVKEDSMPGRVTYMWFYPKEPGEHVATCAEYCGLWHSKMYGKVIVLPQKQFTDWYEQEAARLAARNPEIVKGES